MRLSLRFIVPLLIVLALFAYAVLPIVDGLTVRWFMRDLDIRATLIANTVREPIAMSIRSGDTGKVVEALTWITEDERIYAVAFCESPLATPLSAGSLHDAERGLTVCGYWCAGSRVEDAFLSGLAAARSLDGLER